MRVEVDSDHPIVPSGICCCCGSLPTRSELVSHARTVGGLPVQAKGWYFPYCEVCLGHQRPHRVGSAIVTIGLVLTVLLGLKAPLVWAMSSGGATVLGFAICHHVANVRKSSRCACSHHAVELVGWTGRTSTLVMRSDVFARAFLSANPRVSRQVDGENVG